MWLFRQRTRLRPRACHARDCGSAASRRVTVLRAVAGILIASAIAIAISPTLLKYWSAGYFVSVSQDTRRTVDAWPKRTRERALANADAYNRWLAVGGQPTLGVADNAAMSDEYESLLDVGGGVMGTISIPKINVQLPIRHGTSSNVLSAGAGHLFGTSLPVGGAKTHAVITAHRGLMRASMFTRLDELNAGDQFTLSVMGRSLTYRIDRVKVIKPEDTAGLRIAGDEDRVTLMTCTPYGVNTHRLLVSGVRIDTKSAADENDANANETSRRALAWALTVCCAVCIIGWTLLWCMRPRT